MPITLKTEKLVPVYPKCLRIHFYRFHLSMITYQKSIMLNMENPQFFFLRGEDNHIGLADIQKPDPSITFVKVNFFFSASSKSRRDLSGEITNSGHSLTCFLIC